MIKNGMVSMVNVEYSWIPIKCDGCGRLGHKESRCLQQNVRDLPQTSCDQASVIVAGHVSGNVHVSTAVHASDSATNAATTPSPTSNVPISTTVPTSISVINAAAIPVFDRMIPVSPTTTTPIEKEPITPNVDNVKIISDNSTIKEAAMATSSHINSVTNETAHVIINAITSYVIIPATEYVFLTPSQSRSIQANEEEALIVLGSNPFATFENRVNSCFESTYDMAHKSRGGRHIKSTQKVQEMQWINQDRCKNHGEEAEVIVLHNTKNHGKGASVSLTLLLIL